MKDITVYLTFLLKKIGDVIAIQIWLQQIKSLLSFERILKTWGILPFVVVFVISFLPGGQPLIEEKIKLSTMVIGLLFVWSLQFAIFLQEEGSYIVFHRDNSTETINTNKNSGIFLTTGMLTLIAFFIVGTLKNAPAFALALAVQAVPLFIGKETLKEQARFMGPHIVSIAWILLAILAVNLGL